MSETEPRHLAIVMIGERELTRMFQAPKGTRIMSVHADWMSRSINIMLEGPELPICEDGTVPVLVDAIYEPHFDAEQQFTHMRIQWKWDALSAPPTTPDDHAS